MNNNTNQANRFFALLIVALFAGLGLTSTASAAADTPATVAVETGCDVGVTIGPEFTGFPNGYVDFRRDPPVHVDPGVDPNVEPYYDTSCIGSSSTSSAPTVVIETPCKAGVKFDKPQMNGTPSAYVDTSRNPPAGVSGGVETNVEPYYDTSCIGSSSTSSTPTVVIETPCKAGVKFDKPQITGMPGAYVDTSRNPPVGVTGGVDPNVDPYYDTSCIGSSSASSTSTVAIESDCDVGIVVDPDASINPAVYLDLNRPPQYWVGVHHGLYEFVKVQVDPSCIGS